jgi:hypothetical protein
LWLELSEMTGWKGNSVSAAWLSNTGLSVKHSRTGGGLLMPLSINLISLVLASGGSIPASQADLAT